MKKLKGFSLIELLLTLAVIISITIVAFLLYQKVSVSQTTQKIVFFTNTIRAGIQSVLVGGQYSNNDSLDIGMSNGDSKILKSILGSNYKKGNDVSGSNLTFYGITFEPQGIVNFSPSSKDPFSTVPAVDIAVFVNGQSLCKSTALELFNQGYGVSIGVTNNNFISRMSAEVDVKKAFGGDNAPSNSTNSEISDISTAISTINSDCKSYSQYGDFIPIYIFFDV